MAGKAPDATCERGRMLLNTLRDIESAPARVVEEIARHFDQCEGCNEAEAALQELLALYRNHSSPKIPSEVEQRLLDAICGRFGADLQS